MNGTTVEMCPETAELIRKTLTGIETEMDGLQNKGRRIEALLAGRRPQD